MKRLLAWTLVVLLPAMAFAGQARKQKAADAQTEAWRYEIAPVSVGTQGKCVIKVWSFSKDVNIASEQCKKNALHGVIFKGVPAGDRIPAKAPLVSAADQAANEKFFDSFFTAGGDYMKFVALTNSGATGGEDVVKVNKKEYKVGMTVTINYNELRSYLESKGVVKRLDAGF